MKIIEKNDIQEKIRYRVKCKNCEYVWLARLEEPRSCPACKSRLWNSKNIIIDKTQEDNHE